MAKKKMKMSKAILVFDWYETLKELEDKELLIYINDKDVNYISTEYAYLKPMPKKENIKEWAVTSSPRINERNEWFVYGYNACIDEILGETE